MLPIILLLIFLFLLIDYLAMTKAFWNLKKLNTKHKVEVDQLTNKLHRARKKTSWVWNFLKYLFVIIATSLITLLIVYKLPADSVFHEHMCKVCNWLRNQYILGYILSVLFFLLFYFQWLENARINKTENTNKVNEMNEIDEANKTNKLDT